MAAKDPAAVALGRKGGKAKVSKGPTARMTPEQRHEEMRDAEEAQAYAQAMLGAVGPVEVREIEWKWGPGDVPKSPVARKIADASGAPVIELPIHEDDEVPHA